MLPRPTLRLPSTDEVEIYLARIKGRLKDADISVRTGVIEAIGAQTNAPDLAVPLLLGALPDADDGVSAHAISALSSFGTNAFDAFPTLTNLVNTGRLAEVRSAMRALAVIAPTEALPILSDAVVNGSSDILSVALHNVTALNPELGLRMRFAELRSPDAKRRLRALSGLRNHNIETPGVVEALKRAVDDSDSDVAQSASMQIRALLEKQKENGKRELALPDEPVIQARPLGEWLRMRNQDGQFSTNAVVALREAGTNLFPALFARLNYKDPVFNFPDYEVSIDAVAAFIALGEKAKPALPGLKKIMEADEEDLAVRAMLATLGTGVDAMFILMSGLTNQFVDVRNEAANYLTGEFGAKFPALRKEAIPLLTQLLNDPDESVRRNASSAFKQLSQPP